MVNKNYDASLKFVHILIFSFVPVSYLTEANKLLLPGALMLDHENKKEMDSMTTRWLEQLNSLQDKHGEDVSNIHVQAEKSLVKDYLVHIFLLKSYIKYTLNILLYCFSFIIMWSRHKFWNLFCSSWKGWPECNISEKNYISPKPSILWGDEDTGHRRKISREPINIDPSRKQNPTSDGSISKSNSVCRCEFSQLTLVRKLVGAWNSTKLITWWAPLSGMIYHTPYACNAGTSVKNLFEYSY